MLDSFKRIYWLFFRTELLVIESIKRSPTINKKKLERAVYDLKAKVRRSFHIVVYAAVLSILAYYFYYHKAFYLSHDVVIFMRCISYAVILWGVLSAVSFDIDILGKETFPEITSHEFHKYCYFFGITGLVLSYFLEHRLH